MKLSEMNTEQLLNALCDLTEPICRMAEDERTQDALDALTEAELTALPPLKAGALLLSTLSPLLLQTHREDALRVLSALTGETVQTLRTQNGLITLRQVMDCWEGELAAFFSSAAGSARKGC